MYKTKRLQLNFINFKINQRILFLNKCTMILIKTKFMTLDVSVMFKSRPTEIGQYISRPWASPSIWLQYLTENKLELHSLGNISALKQLRCITLVYVYTGCDVSTQMYDTQRLCLWGRQMNKWKYCVDFRCGKPVGIKWVSKLCEMCNTVFPYMMFICTSLCFLYDTHFLLEGKKD